jgi:hypothetical protein
MGISLAIGFSGTTFEHLESASFIAKRLLSTIVASGKEFTDFSASPCLQVSNLCLIMHPGSNNGQPTGILLWREETVPGKGASIAVDALTHSGISFLPE